ncbi:tetratricopeptide repeat protein [Nautilia sp.]
MKKLFFLLPVIIFADVNPFKAGDLNTPNPYGLTPQEKTILQNKKNINKNSKEISELKKSLKKFESSIAQKFVLYDQSISELENKLSSFDTILSEIDSAKIAIDSIKKELKNKEKNLTDITEKIKTLEEKISALEAQNDSIKQTIEEITKVQNENFQNLSSSIQDILNQLKQLNSVSHISPKEAFDEAKKNFFDGKLEKARELFLYSLQKGHMPATSSYYLGEIAFKKRRYKEALAYYKKSITLYPKKTSFTARLLYHTGVSFKKLNQKNRAKLTFKKIISDFPGSKYALLAKKELEKL